MAGSYREAYKCDDCYAWSDEKREDVWPDGDSELKFAKFEARGNPYLKKVQETADLEFGLW